MHISRGWGGPRCGDWHYMQLPTGALTGKEQLDYQRTPYRLLIWTKNLMVLAQTARNIIIGIVLEFIITTPMKLKFRDWAHYLELSD